jgi:hypothetical protein
MKNIPAFPSKQKALMIKSEHIGIASEYEIDMNGMTLRDYFAAKATEEDVNAHREGPMEEHIADDVNGRKYITHRSTRYTREQAKYRYADAMLKEREA